MPDPSAAAQPLDRDAVMAMLAAAGFDRGITSPPEKAQAGYAVVNNRPGDGTVLVNWWPAKDEFPIPSEEDASREQWLETYARTLTAAGLSARISWHDEGKPDYLIVTAPKEN